MNINTVLDGKSPPVILGEDVEKVVKQTLKLLEFPGAPPVMFVGPPGSGKTHILKAIALAYAQDRGCKAHYMCLNTESVRTDILGGKEIQNGSLVVVAAAVGRAMQDGDVIVLDEIGHAPENIPPTLNTVSDQDSITYYGGLTLRAHKNFRLLIASNRASKDALNSPLAPSFASRPIIKYLGYPNIKTEAAIAKLIAMRDMFGDVSRTTEKKFQEIIPETIVRYVAYLIRVLREGGPEGGNKEQDQQRSKLADLVPISARNSANVFLNLAILDKDLTVDIAREFTTGQQEPKRRTTIERVFWTNEKNFINSTDLNNPKVLEFLRFVSQVGKDNFIDAVLEGVGYHADIAGIPFDLMDKWREMARSTII